MRFEDIITGFCVAKTSNTQNINLLLMIFEVMLNNQLLMMPLIITFLLTLHEHVGAVFLIFPVLLIFPVRLYQRTLNSLSSTSSPFLQYSSVLVSVSQSTTTLAAFTSSSFQCFAHS